MNSLNPASIATVACVIASSALLWYYFQPQKPQIEEIGPSDLTPQDIERIHQRALDEVARRNRERQEAALANLPDDSEESESEDDNNEEQEPLNDDERARRALEDAQRNQPPPRQNRWKTRGEVGAKKAKSLARREQRRAYYEHVGQVAAQEREKRRIEEEMFGDLIAEEQAERERQEEQARLELEERTRQRRLQEQQDKAHKLERKEHIQESLVRYGRVQLESELDVILAADMDDVLIVDDGKWAITVTAEILTSFVNTITENNGRATYNQLHAALAS